jgi:transposase
LQKPNGLLTPRVQAAGAEHFGIVAVDCAKHRSRYFLADFYGRVLLEPATVAHSRGDLQAAIERVRQAVRQHQLGDLVVAIERTGTYHRPVQHAFRQADFETRLVHPFTSKKYRQPADPGHKTDDTDLAAIWRAATHGFGLLEPTWPDAYVTLQLLRRHRRDLVNKTSALQCQIREVLHAAMPGYAECFCHLWDDSPAPLVIARHATSAAAVRQLGVAGLEQIARQAGLRCRADTFHKIRAWAQQAPPDAGHTADRRRLLVSRDDDRLAKTQQILELERDLAHGIVPTPYVLLLAIPGITVVTVADLAGELGPLPLYRAANALTGRAGLVPTRYQSDQVDRANGPLRRRGHRRLRAVLMQTADNLARCNHYYRARAAQWGRAGKDPRWVRVKIAKIFSRLAYALVAGRQLFPHPCCQRRHAIIAKLLAFHGAHGTDLQAMRQDLEAAADQLPVTARAREAAPLQKELDALAQRRGVQPLAAILPLVLARLAGRVVPSTSESAGPEPVVAGRGAPNALSNRRAARPWQTVALWRVTTPDAAGWGLPLRYHVGETVTAPASRDRLS